VTPGAFESSVLAERLGVKQFEQAESLSEKLGLPSSVEVQSRSEATDRIVLRLKEDFDPSGDEFLSFLHDAYEAFPRE
jgi:hypothetical protein